MIPARTVWQTSVPSPSSWLVLLLCVLAVEFTPTYLPTLQVPPGTLASWFQHMEAGHGGSWSCPLSSPDHHGGHCWPLTSEFLGLQGSLLLLGSCMHKALPREHAPRPCLLNHHMSQSSAPGHTSSPWGVQFYPPTFCRLPLVLL